MSFGTTVLHDFLRHGERDHCGMLATVVAMVAARSTSWRMGLAPRAAARQRDAAVRLPPSAWAALLADPETVAAYYRNVCLLAPGQDWPWPGPSSRSRAGR